METCLFNYFPEHSAEGERSISKMIMLKSYLRNSITTKRFNQMIFLNTYREELEQFDIFEIGKSFVDKVSRDRLRMFGDFTATAIVDNTGKHHPPKTIY